MKKKVVLRIFIGFFAFVLITMVAYQIYHHFDYAIDTQIAEHTTYQESATAQGIAVRNEQVMQNSANGVIYYTVPDGTRVQKDATVAKVYQSAADYNKEVQLVHVQNEIALLNEALANKNPDYLDSQLIANQIDLTIRQIVRTSAEGILEDVEKLKNGLLLDLNKSRIASSKEKDFSARLAELKKQETEIKSSTGSVSSIKSSSSGYFISYVDGYESALKTQEIDKLDEQTLNGHLASTIQPTKAVGKMVSDYNWYFACEVDKTYTKNIVQGTTKNVQFPLVSTNAIPAYVEAVNEGSKKDVVILRLDYMTDALSKIRKQTAQILIKSYTGIRVDKEAVHIIDGQKGVYVLAGLQAKFKAIEPIYYAGDSIICAVSPTVEQTKEKTYPYLQVNDEVIVKGKDLYDGKIVK